jgi:REP element-mobilizing transposase RayT
MPEQLREVGAWENLHLTWVCEHSRRLLSGWMIEKIKINYLF